MVSVHSTENVPSKGDGERNTSHCEIPDFIAYYTELYECNDRRCRNSDHATGWMTQV
jgi:hypothetical protein